MVTWTARLCWLNTSPLDLLMFQGNLCLYNRLMLGIVNLFGGSSACTVSIIGNFFLHLRFRLVTWNPLKQASCWVKGIEFSFLKLIIRISWKKVQILEKLFERKKVFFKNYRIIGKVLQIVFQWETFFCPKFFQWLNWIPIKFSKHMLAKQVQKWRSSNADGDQII